MSLTTALKRTPALLTETLPTARSFSTRSSTLRAIKPPYPKPNPATTLATSLDSLSTAFQRDDTASANLLNTIQWVSKMQPATGTAPPALSAADEVAKAWRRAALERGQSRRWAVGDVYAPHDLSPAETKKWRLRTKPERDVFDLLGVDPMDEYKNYTLLSEFMTSMGRIKHRRETGLRPVNQRKMARAIRRAIGMGLIPSVHRHPEILRRVGPE